MDKGEITLADILTEDEKEMIKEYRETMNMTWSRLKSDQYYQIIMDILDEAEERYYENENNY